MTRVLASYEPCGCNAAVYVLDNHPASAYEMAAEESKRGCAIEQMEIEDWRARPMKCADHPHGPPWWQTNGGNGIRPDGSGVLDTDVEPDTDDSQIGIW